MGLPQSLHSDQRRKISLSADYRLEFGYGEMSLKYLNFLLSKLLLLLLHFQQYPLFYDNKYLLQN